MAQQLLLKIGKREHMQDLCENGTVFMQRLSAYRNVESKVVGDPNEGLLLHFTSDNSTVKITVTVAGLTIPFERGDWQSLKVNCSALHHGVYCMSAIEVPGDGTFNSERDLIPFMSDKRLLGFGDTLVIFKDSPEFIRRFDVAARDAGHELDLDGPGLVQYVGSDYCGKVGPYVKIGDYAYQQEFRFMSDKPIPGSSLTLKLGRLTDIATWVDLAAFHQSSAA
jgi:hypothetical protein